MIIEKCLRSRALSGLKLLKRQKNTRKLFKGTIRYCFNQKGSEDIFIQIFRKTRPRYPGNVDRSITERIAMKLSPLHIFYGQLDL